MQEQDKEFKIGQKVRYLGGDDLVFQEPNAIGFITDDAYYWKDFIEVEFETHSQIVLKSCLEIVE